VAATALNQRFRRHPVLERSDGEVVRPIGELVPQPAFYAAALQRIFSSKLNTRGDLAIGKGIKSIIEWQGVITAVSSDIRSACSSDLE
jgi:hypothetical protein